MNGSIGADFVANHQEDPMARRKRLDAQARREEERQLKDKSARHAALANDAPCAVLAEAHQSLSNAYGVAALALEELDHAIASLA